MFERWIRRRPKTIGLVPIAEIAEAAESILGSLKWKPDGFICRSGEIETQVQVEDVTTMTREGKATLSVLKVRTGFPAGFPHLSPQQISVTNMVAVADALLLDEKSGQLSFNSRVTIFPGFEAAWALYRKFIIASVCGQRSLLPTIIAASRAPAVPSPDEASPWTADDFQVAEEVFISRGWCTSSGDSWITTELSWDPGAFKATLGGGRTALLQIKTSEVNPCAGRGLFAKLELPINFGEEGRASVIANRLNCSEYKAVDAPPFWGAWIERFDVRRLAFVCFVPDALYHRGLTVNIGSWMAGRTELAKEALAAMEIR